MAEETKTTRKIERKVILEKSPDFFSGLVTGCMISGPSPSGNVSFNFYNDTHSFLNEEFRLTIEVDDENQKIVSSKESHANPDDEAQNNSGLAPIVLTREHVARITLPFSSFQQFGLAVLRHLTDNGILEEVDLSEKSKGEKTDG